MSIFINLQLFAGGAGDKTEKATPKKRQEARKKGQVLQSREVTAALVLTFAFICIRLLGGNAYSNISNFMGKLYTQYAMMPDLYTSSGLNKLFQECVQLVAGILIPVFAVALIIGTATGFAQVGFLFTMEPLSFKISRLNPFNGLKRLFSSQGAMELAKSVLKIAIVGYVAFSYFNGEAENIIKLMEFEPLQIGSYVGITAMNIAIRICVVLVLLGLVDYGYQWWEYEKNLKMSKQEVKEEYKQTEGNPEVKSRIKQKQRQISMRRMLTQVPQADVVITNPTHFAVALKYDANESDAPMVLAKGQDFMALRIKEIAKENKVEIVENKTLARTLYETVEVGDAVPPELYQAVAEVLAFVYGLQGKVPG